MSLFSRLFGGPTAPKPAAAPKTLEHKGFLITATPFQERERWQVCGLIAWTEDGVAKEETFIRADSSTSRDDAVEMTFFKARQIIDQRDMQRP